ncbi:exosome complex component RRP42 isoform X2 [Dunckerocampus dactyliophorus]|nr:exosome complex component RRP42 isoform X2 [Dunckerocampus dactyliophorus]
MSAQPPEDAPLPKAKRKQSLSTKIQKSMSTKRPNTVSEVGHDVRWHNREEQDTRPEPLLFLPARTPGPTLSTTTSWRPLSLFQLFFSASVVHTIIDNTNSNAAKRQQAGKKYTWKPLTVKDFYIFLTIILFSGLVSVHHRSDYWKKDWPYNFHFPRELMSRDRFEAILWSLHLSSPQEDEENEGKRNTPQYDSLFKLKPLYSEIVNACKAHFQPYKNICVDERLVASKTHVHARESMKNKLTKLGYKLFVLADCSTGYTWNFFICRESNMDTSGHTSVMDLLPAPLLGSGYSLYVDHFCTSPALFAELFARGIGCCGAMRKNINGFPQTEDNDLPRKAARGDLRWIRKDKLLFVKWMDMHEVSMCSTFHKAFSGQTVERKVKEDGAWAIKHIPVPDAVVDYNQNMGGVGVSDALIRYYSVRQKTMKWYKTFFYHFIDIAVVNSFLLYKELFKLRGDPYKLLTHKGFREQLCKEMLALAKSSEPTPRSPLRDTCMPVYYGEDATASRRYCKRCHDAGNKRVKTPIHCRKCLVPLCLTSRKNCFAEWHDGQVQR